ncbi:hypothetical protein BP6252_10831 [Coleophoma cylindrospora]|uniref:Oxidoreductase acuF-like C2H2 type zinc-finger domain-containing protein n=1 Tax=Coleophoma cylindrospora TaxID=1849047 RepID=A0A3D8QN89_9HELO|nr:hypothetical protein BP6252_10831 [Coleophoma cylindrospora]
MSSEATSIADEGRACMRFFGQLILAYETSDGQKNSGVKFSTVVDEFSRFKLWAGNIGVLHDAEWITSLDHRLRDNQRMRSYITKLLHDIAMALGEFTTIASGNIENRHTSVIPHYIQDTSHQDLVLNDSGTNSHGIFETQIILYSISSTISTLFQLSTLIRQATPRDRYERAAIVAATRKDSFQAESELAHVKEKCPRLKGSGQEWLAERLADAIKLRREYLRYCEEHQEKFKQDLTSAHRDIGPPVSAASSLGTDQLESTVSELGLGRLSLIAGLEDTQSQTSSYASSLGTGEEESDYELHLSKIEDVNNGRKEFECPFCHDTQNIQQQKLWKYAE